MTIFILFAALLVLATTGWIGVALWRASARRTALCMLLLVLVGSAALYVHWSDWHWPQAETQADSSAVISRLARQLEREPDNVEGWLLLARSHAAIGQYPLAQRAFQRALRLEDGRNVEALVGLGELRVLQAEGEVDDRAARFFEQALLLQPDSERALFFAAVAAQRRGDTVLALARFERMLAQNPPENIQAILRQQIDALRTSTRAAASSSSRVADSESAANGDRIRVRISLSPALSARVRGVETLFVFARRPGVPGPPLAVKRLPAALPQTVELTGADSMVPGLKIAVGDTVEVSAKLSVDGSATPKSGEPIGRLRYTVGQDGERELVIDGLTP